MPEITHCPERVFGHGGFHSHACGRPVKRDGLCGIHAAAKEKIAKDDRERAERKAEAQIVVDRLAEHGVRSYATGDGVRITTRAADLADLLDGKAGR